MLDNRLLVVPWQKSSLSLRRVTCALAAPSPKRPSILRVSSRFSYALPAFRQAATAGQQTRRGVAADFFPRSVIVDAIAGADEKTNLNHKPLYDELQRYGVDESDYDFTAISKPYRSTGNMQSKTGPSKREAIKLIGKQPTLKEEFGVIEDWCAYVLLSADSHKTYIGVTYDIRRRLRQHNGEIAGGAKAARAGRPWRVVCIVRGFSSRSEACQFEWIWKSTAAKVKTIPESGSTDKELPLITRRRTSLAEVLKDKEEWRLLEVQWHIGQTSR